MPDWAQTAIVGALVGWAAWRVWLRYGPIRGRANPKAQQSACGSCGKCTGAPSCPPGASTENPIHFSAKP